MKNNLAPALAFGLTLLASSVPAQATITSFTAGTAISSSAVNGNFTDLDTRVTALGTQVTGLGGNLSFAGDVVGSPNATSVVKIAGLPVSAPTATGQILYRDSNGVLAPTATPVNGQFLTFASGAWVPVTLGGDVSASGLSLTVDKIKGVAVAASPNGATRQFLAYDAGASQLVPTVIEGLGGIAIGTTTTGKIIVDATGVTGGGGIGANGGLITGGPLNLKPASDFTPLILEASATQTTPLLQIQGSGGTPLLASIDASGVFHSANFNEDASGNLRIGLGSTAPGGNALAIGKGALSASDSSIAIGVGATVPAATPNTLVFGSPANRISDIYFGAGINVSAPSLVSIHGTGGVAGGTIRVIGGIASSGAGGDVHITAGDSSGASGVGGNVLINGGTGTIASGGVGIGMTTPPQATLDVNGTARLKVHTTKPFDCNTTSPEGVLALSSYNGAVMLCICKNTSPAGWKGADGVSTCGNW
jgi:hypothetical protein